MTHSSQPLYTGDAFVPTPVDRFLWWLATAEQELIADCVVDRNRYRIVGCTVLATWLFASFAWIYFFSTVISSIPMYVGSGLFMGFVILTIDRALIKGIHRGNKGKLLPLLLRASLAITIGTFMAQPALLYMFNKEISLQVSLDNEKRRQTKRSQLEALYQSRKTEMQQQRNALQQQLNQHAAQVSTARDRYLAEADGSGGTGTVGIKDIALAKKAEYLKLEEEHRALELNNLAGIARADTALNNIETTIREQESAFTSYLNTGFLTRIEALNNLVSNNTALSFRYYLILLLLTLIELMPVLAKSMLPAGVYDMKVQKREQLELQLMEEKHEYEREMKQHFNRLSKAHDTETMEAFFQLQQEQQASKLMHLGKEWKRHDEHMLGFWAKVKEQMISRPES